MTLCQKKYGWEYCTGMISGNGIPQKTYTTWFTILNGDTYKNKLNDNWNNSELEYEEVFDTEIDIGQKLKGFMKQFTSGGLFLNNEDDVKKWTFFALKFTQYYQNVSNPNLKMYPGHNTGLFPSLIFSADSLVGEIDNGEIVGDVFPINDNLVQSSYMPLFEHNYGYVGYNYILDQCNGWRYVNGNYTSWQNTPPTIKIYKYMRYPEFYDIMSASQNYFLFCINETDMSVETAFYDVEHDTLYEGNGFRLTKQENWDNPLGFWELRYGWVFPIDFDWHNDYEFHFKINTVDYATMKCNEIDTWLKKIKVEI